MEEIPFHPLAPLQGGRFTGGETQKKYTASGAIEVERIPIF
jgi:hypothetical protein